MSRALNRALLEHEVMPTVNGDPVVESGSNADGEWTRWADGTQTADFSALPSTRDGQRFMYTWTPPVSFLSGAPVSLSVTPNANSIFQVGWTSQAVYATTAEEITGAYRFYVFASGQDISTGWGSVNSYLSARGSWK